MSSPEAQVEEAVVEELPAETIEIVQILSGFGLSASTIEHLIGELCVICVKTINK